MDADTAAGKTKTVLFVADASVEAGAGHVERCMALAEQFRHRDWRCIFISSPESSSIVPSLKQYERLSAEQDLEGGAGSVLHALAPNSRGLAVVDHYGWAASLETRLRVRSTSIMVIDDLANRKHDCDILLDQTIGRLGAAYDGLVPSHCQRLVGATYALLRPEFALHRSVALARRREGRVARVLVNFGGSDPRSNTLLALRALLKTGLTLAIDVAIGAGAPKLAEVAALCEIAPIEVALHVNSRQMAKLMTNADLAIGAAGIAAMERCVVGLPSLVLIDADNQDAIARELGRRGAALIVGRAGDVSEDVLADAINEMHQVPDSMRAMASAAAQLCDGLGARRTAELLEKCLAA